VKQRESDNFRSRSAYKIAEIDDKFRFIQYSRTIVDLGGAPGGWSQMVASRWNQISQRSSSNHRRGEEVESGSDALVKPSSSARTDGRAIIALDILDIDPIPGVDIIKGNFLLPEVNRRLDRLLQNKAVDAVISDMAPNASGNHIRDISQSLQLCEAALAFAESRFAAQIQRPPGAGPRKTLMCVVEYCPSIVG
jgi:23S rRNA (uridine2552-2'-O)-methyltransferase